MNKTVTIDLSRAARADITTARRAAVDNVPLPAAHPQSLLDLPPGEARQSLLAVHGILDSETAADRPFDLRSWRRFDQFPAA